MTYDNDFILVKNTRSSYKERKEQRKDVEEVKSCQKDIFCHDLYKIWVERDIPINIPILIMNNENLEKNKDVNTIPRICSKYYIKKMCIPFIFKYEEEEYQTLNEYFKAHLDKEVPSSNEFKKLLLEKEDIEENEDFYESVNLFLYTSFLLRQFSCAMKMVPNFYSPISDEAKYYFYLCVDCMRRKCIEENRELMRSEILSIMRKICMLDKLVLTEERMRRTFPFLDETFFQVNIFLLQENVFHFLHQTEQT